MKQIKGYQFYRQKPIGEYIVDFFCPKAKLVIEVDGGQHFSGETVEYDRIRDEYLSSLGLKVLRFTNNDVLMHIEEVAENIEMEIPLTEIPLSPPFSKGETKQRVRQGNPLPFVKGDREGFNPGIKGVGEKRKLP